MAGVLQADLLLLQRVALFEGLDGHALEQVHQAAQRRRLSAGAVLFRQEDEAHVLYVVLEGRLRVSELTPEGHEVLLRFIEPGQPVGLMAALEGAVYPVTAQAAQSSRVLCWRREAMERLMDRHPRLARNAMRLMVGRIRELQQRVVELATERVEQRVARAILRLVRQAGKRTSEGVLLEMPLSRQDLAALTGTTLYTVSRLLNRWQEQGLVSIGRRRIVLRRPHELVALADALAE
ncbi:MAG TPA: Crp/Fnr family transcriptional regulator [Phycisphaeraceae bacterium]